MTRKLAAIGLVSAVVALTASTAWAQGYGTDSQNVLTPATGGMAGVSVAEPQDVPAAIFGNPATLSQFRGTQFTLGGGWVEGYPSVTNDGSLPGGIPFSVTSGTQGFAGSGIGVAQDLRPLGLPGTLGLGLAGLSGLGAEYRGRAPAGSYANDISGEYFVLGINLGAGFELIDRLSAGATMTLGTGFSQMGLTQTSAMVHDYALRGTFGLNYALNDCNTLGAYYQTKLGFQFPNAFRLPGGEYRNVNIEQPETVGFGLANRRLLSGDLLLAADVYYKSWENADLYRDVFLDQWAFALGTQLTRGKMKYRLGYSYNSSPVNHNVGNSLNGHPVAQEAIYFLQATSLAAINQHRITGGFGREDFLLPGLDLDFFAGGLPKTSDSFGDHTRASVAVWYIGLGLTWRFGDSEAQ